VPWDRPATEATVTSTAPAGWAGVTAVICVPEVAVKLAAGTAPKYTAVTPASWVPVMVTAVAPAAGPWAGATAVTVGVV